MVKCKQCGNEFDEQYGVCPKCETVYEAEEKLPEIKPPAETLPELKEYSDEKSVGKKKPKTKLFVIIGIVAAVVIIGIIAGIIIAASDKGGTSEFDEQISLGEKYLKEENYDEAIAAFKKAIEIDPNNPEGYINLADAYLAKGDTQNAISALETGYERTGSEKIKTKLDKVRNGDFSEDSEPEEVSKEEYKDPEYTLGNIVDSGKYGDNVTWQLDDKGLLVISGNGEIVKRLAGSSTPWKKKHESVKSVIIKKGVTSIGEEVFFNCTSLTSITIPDSVTSIGNYAFAGCTSLTSIKIPDSVTSIGYMAFSSTAWYDSQPDGVVYAGKVAYEYKGKMPANTKVVLQDGTTGIAEHAFSRCSSLTSITIPDGVTSIGHDAFFKCSSLTSITIPDSVTSIEDYAFRECTSLTSITIPNSVTSIGAEAFAYCESLTNITIPDSVTSIGRLAFGDTAWYKSQPDGVVYAGKVAYGYKGGMPANTHIVLKEGTKGIACSAFYECTSLTSITIPDSVTSIGKSAFGECVSLTSITIPDSVTRVESGVFSGWTSSQTIYIKGRSSAPSGWSEDWNEHCNAKIVWNAESDNTSKPETSKPETSKSETSKPETSKPETSKPETSTPVETSKPAETSKEEYKDPEYTLGTIVRSGNCGKNGNNVTYQLDNNGVLVISGSGEMRDFVYHDSPWYKKRLGLLQIEIVIVKKGVTSIGHDAFRECTSLTSITIPDSVTSIGAYAFSHCTSLTSITIPDSVTSIVELAFENCTNLTSITIPDSVTSIGGGAFRGTAWYDSQPDGVVYAGKVAYEYKGEMPANTNIVLKEGTKGIGGAFCGCTSLTSINIPDGVTRIGDSAFGWCTSLTSITIPDSVTSIGAHAFSHCTSLTSITIPDSVTSIGYGTFESCTSLTSITIPNSVTSIGDDAFDNTAWYKSQPDGVVYAGKVAYGYKGEMPANTNIVLKEGTKEIACDAFYGCTSLTSITIPDSVTRIGESAFEDCESLTSINIPDSVTSIEEWAFKNCTSLTSITIPDSVTSIGFRAFDEWKSSQTIYIKGISKAPSRWDEYWNGGCNAKIVWNA